MSKRYFSTLYVCDPDYGYKQTHSKKFVQEFIPHLQGDDLARLDTSNMSGCMMGANWHSQHVSDPIFMGNDPLWLPDKWMKLASAYGVQIFGFAQGEAPWPDLLIDYTNEHCEITHDVDLKAPQGAKYVESLNDYEFKRRRNLFCKLAWNIHIYEDHSEWQKCSDLIPSEEQEIVDYNIEADQIGSRYEERTYQELRWPCNPPYDAAKQGRLVTNNECDDLELL